MVEAAPETPFSLLPDPLPDRKLTDEECPKIINKPVDDSVLWNSEGIPNWTVLKDFLAREGPISKPQIMRLLMSTL